MNRRVAILVGSIMAALAAAEIIVLSGLLAAERRGDRDRYDQAMSRQRRAAGRPVQSSSPPAKRSGPQTFCVRGVDTFATTARKALQKELLDGDRHLDTAELIELSDLAIRAERYVETANAGPALPQRLGRARVTETDAAANAESKAGTQSETSSESEPKPKWRPIEPARIECDDSEAYTAFRLTIDAPLVTPEPPKAPASTKKRKTGKKKPGRR